MTRTPNMYARALTALASEKRLDDAAALRFFRIVRANGDLSALAKILRLFRQYADAAAGVTRIEVFAARGPEHFAKAVRSRLGAGRATTIVRAVLAPELVGGLRIRINDRITIDASVRRRLERLFPSRKGVHAA